MSFILNWLFDDYGFPSVWWWVFVLFLITIFSVVTLYAVNYKNLLLIKIIIFVSGIVYTGIFFFITIFNPYQYMAVSGTAIQKLNVQRCTEGITVTHNNIKGIMFACDKQEM